MKICPTCEKTYPDDFSHCPSDGSALLSAANVTQADLESTLGRKFRLVRRLGAGGMGTVFLAEQIAVGNRPVALKVLLRKLIDDPEFLLRFQNEAASTGRIHHANVVTIYESGQSDDGSPYIAMEYLEGESLRQALERRGSFPVEECADILQQAARGLNAAHRLGIIHRDLKPDNIFLTRAADDVGAGLAPPSSVLPSVASVSPPTYSRSAPPLVKIVDFGIAKLRERVATVSAFLTVGFWRLKKSTIDHGTIGWSYRRSRSARIAEVARGLRRACNTAITNNGLSSGAWPIR